MQAGDRKEPNWASDTNSAKRRQVAPTEILLDPSRSAAAGCPPAGVDQHVRRGAWLPSRSEFYAEDRSGERLESADANLSSRQLKAIKEKRLQGRPGIQIDVGDATAASRKRVTALRKRRRLNRATKKAALALLGA